MKKPQKANTKFQSFLRQAGIQAVPERQIEKQADSLWPRMAESMESHEKLKAFWKANAEIHSKIRRTAGELGMMEHEAKALFRFGNFQPAERIASIGSGASILEAFIAKEVIPKGRMTCIDYAKTMGRQAMQLKARINSGNLHALTADGIKMPLRSNSQDKVIALQFTASYETFKPFFKEAFRVLKKEPHARLVFSSAFSNQEHLAAVQAMLEHEGFTAENIIPFNQAKNGTGIMIFARPVLF